MKRYGKKKWRRCVADVVEKLAAGLEPDDVVLGGGNVKFLKTMPAKCRAGDNANAFKGGFRLWEDGPMYSATQKPHAVSAGGSRPMDKSRAVGK